MLTIFNICYIYLIYKKKQQQNSRAHSLVQCWVLEAGRSSTLRLVYPKKGIRHTCKSYPCNTTNTHTNLHMLKKHQKAWKRSGGTAARSGGGSAWPHIPLPGDYVAGTHYLWVGIQQPGSRSSGPTTAALLHFGGLACVFGAILPPKAFLPADPCVLEIK